MGGRRFAGLLVALSLLGAAARLAAMWARIGVAAEDPDRYLTLARSLAEGRGFTFSERPTAYRPPLYPIALAPWMRSAEPLAAVPQVWGTLRVYPFSRSIAALHLLLGAATVALTMLAARRWGLPPVAIAAAGLIVALDPLLVLQSRSVMTETLAAALLAWALAASARGGLGGAIGAGLAFGLAALCRPSTLPAAALAVAFLALTGPEDRLRRLRLAMAMTATLVATAAPWAIRNRLALGEFVWGTTHGGYTLALANNPDYYRDVLDGPPGAVWDATKQAAWAGEIAAATAGMSEPEADRRLARSGWRMARDRPRDFARASLARIGRLWSVAPSASVYGRATRWASAAWNVPLFALALVGLSRREAWRGPRAVAAGILLGISCVHCFYWTDMRMRAPMVPAIALTAAGAVAGPRKIREKNPESPRGRVVGIGWMR